MENQFPFTGINFPLMGIEFPLMGIEFPLMRNTDFLQGWSAIQFPETHGEEHLVVMLKGLYTNLAALTTFGDWLEDTG